MQLCWSALRRTDSPEGPLRIVSASVSGGILFPTVGKQSMRPGGRNALVGGHARRRSRSVPRAGGLSPVARLGPKVFQWSAEPNSSVTLVTGRIPGTSSLKPISRGVDRSGSVVAQGGGLLLRGVAPWLQVSVAPGGLGPSTDRSNMVL